MFKFISNNKRIPRIIVNSKVSSFLANVNRNPNGTHKIKICAKSKSTNFKYDIKKNFFNSN